MGGSSQGNFGRGLDLVASEYGKDPFWVLNELDPDQFDRLIELIGERKAHNRTTRMEDFRCTVAALFSEDGEDAYRNRIEEILTGEIKAWSNDELRSMGLGHG